MNEIGRKITDKLIEIHGSADFTIAFLPYKRSMWDSMESVFEECLKSGIDAHCIPIPYYRKKANKQIDYIDNDFICFDFYAEPVANLETLKPDFIAIHYQYDNNNSVTGMLPQYCTDALKEKYQCDIIYLPYGIPYGGTSIRHFRIQPGIANVDYFFLNSEAERIGFIADWAEMGIDMTDKVFGFGSPKIDAVLKATKAIPTEWQQAIGSRTVILVANSLGPYLARPFERLKAYEHYITKELEQNHAVIFRPHPLLSTTINSMRPDTMAAYHNFIDKFWNEPHCIIDHSEYLERAIGVADRLISDPSSIVELWRATGKPYKVI